MEALLNEKVLTGYLKEMVDKYVGDYLDSLTVWWDMETFNERCGCSKGQAWIVKNILEPYRDEIDVRNGGWCRYYYGGRSSYQFIAKEACEWIEKHAHEIDWSSEL